MSRINYSDFYKYINFDVNSQLKETYVVKQNDTLSRGFYVKVIQNGRVVQPTEYDKMTLYVKKPDGKDIFEEGTISFDRFKIGLPNQALTVPGAMRAEFTLRGADGEVISSKDFTIIVNESFPMDPVESTDEFGALQSTLAQIAGFAGELQDAQLFAESIKANLGELEDLDTDTKENAVAAINELNGKIDNVLNSEELETLLTAKVDKDTLGDMSQLATEEKEILVLAINELFNSIEEVKEVSDVSTLLPLLNSKADKSTVGDIANLVDFEDEEVEVANLVEAVNYTYQLLIDSLEGIGDVDLEGLALSEDLGDKEELTTEDKTNLVNAINEINAALKTVESVTNVEQLSILLSGKADKSSLGNLSELTTVQKNNLVAAINEINEIIDGLGDVDFTEIYTLLEGKVSQDDFDDAISAIELTPGQQGEPGLSAYQVWLDEGNEGTEQDFIDSLEGPPGPPGQNAEGPGESDVELSYTGKVLISNAINDKGVNANYEDTFIQLADKVRSIETPITIGLRDLSNAFAGTEADTIDLRFVDTSRLWNANRMFLNANIGVLDISMNNLGDLRDVQYMFSGANIGEIRARYQDTNLVTNCSYMFQNSDIKGSVKIADIIDTRNVTNMQYMFQNSQATTLDLSSFDTSSVTNMQYMFQNSQATTLDLSSFDTSSVTNMASMFRGSQATTLDLSSFDTSSVTNMASMLWDSQAATLDLSSFDTSSVTDMQYMFRDSQAATLDLSSFDTSSVTDMQYMFRDSQAATLDLSSFDTSSVTDMQYMFSGSQARTLDLSSFDTSKVTDMQYMFSGSQARTLDLSSFDTSKVTRTNSMRNMFEDCAATVGYARTQADADKFNATSNKPAGLTFVVKPGL